MDVIARRIAEATSLPLIWRDMTRYFRSQGFAANSYYIVRSGSSLPATIPLQHGFSRQEMDAYVAYDFQRLDLVPRVAIAAGVPVRWSEAWASAQTTPEERAFHEALVAAGFSDGYALPCYGPGGRNAVVSLGHMTHGTPPEPALLLMLHFAAQAAHLRICALFSEATAPGRDLSSREKEILDWVARGKSNTVIADILEIAPGTVDTYMRRIYEKLDVSDRTSAAVKGIGMGLIAA